MNKIQERFDIPIVLFIFKRADTTVKIIEQIAKVKPKTLYLLGDQGRNDEERKMVNNCRKAVEAAIDWECEVIKNYAEENRGVYENIGLGAKWVFEREETAIFLEDDNLPEVSFFNYCKELLERYRDNEDIFWICGTNYLGKYDSPTGDSYMFTKHLLPCGWASWSYKFLHYYDGELENAAKKEDLNLLRKKYDSKQLYEQQEYCIRRELHRKEIGKRFISWDYQMAFSIRFFNKLGISPCVNQIKNVGADGLSEHGGNDITNVMTNRFCSMPSHYLDFPLKHPESIKIDEIYEKRIHDIILNPIWMRMRRRTKSFFFRLLGVNDTIPFAEFKEQLKKRYK